MQNKLNLNCPQVHQTVLITVLNSPAEHFSGSSCTDPGIKQDMYQYKYINRTYTDTNSNSSSRLVLTST